ncbi:unknown protein [Simkania negevensis Z]|uniref:Uncharacterized protein n=1 Tax=Simkania negevensis (strain ATCC VR-1471 / DSM 27360 / Z) TaxID=331113 RepID=F8L7M8_SIMNZ|nr:unknown protein [Simkania negevensis Z]
MSFKKIVRKMSWCQKFLQAEAVYRWLESFFEKLFLEIVFIYTNHWVFQDYLIHQWRKKVLSFFQTS